MRPLTGDAVEGRSLHVGGRSATSNKGMHTCPQGVLCPTIAEFQDKIPGGGLHHSRRLGGDQGAEVDQLQ